MPRMYATRTLFVDVDWRDRDLCIAGLDLAPSLGMGADYEYWITVPATQRPELARALDVEDDPSAILDALVARGEEICRAGERTWLAERGVETEFFSYF